MRLLDGIQSHPKAIFSDELDFPLYRYTLWRTTRLTSFHKINSLWWPERFVNFICLNPSTATDEEDDPTVRKCQTLARLWGLDAICVTNVFALRSTNPNRLKQVTYDPIGEMNDFYIREIAQRASLVVCAWGTHARHLDRSKRVVRKLRFEEIKLHYLRMGKHEPWHPLYLPNSTKAVRWE